MKKLPAGHMDERRQWNRLEDAFATYWENQSGDFGFPRGPNGSDLLPLIIGKQPTARDRFVAASLIQWLGTNCGFSMIQTCLNKVGMHVYGNEPRLPLAWVREDDPLAGEIQNARVRKRENLLVVAAAAEARQAVFDEAEPY